MADEHSAIPPKAAARLALDILRELGDAEQRAIYDPRLNAALDPLRSHPALEAVCGKPRCVNRRLAWWAVAPGAAYIAATQERASPRSRRGGMSDLAQPPPHPVQGFMPWIELAMSGETTVTLADVKTPGWPVRLRFTCRTCQTPYMLTNTRRLTDYLEAITASTGRISVNY